MTDSTTRVAPESYDVCLSFANEQRDYVHEVARLLKAVGLTVFYDLSEETSLLGTELVDHLTDVYGRASRCCVLFASTDYRRKVWTNHERVAAQNRAVKDSKTYLIPVRFDDTVIPDLADSVGFADARTTSPAELVQRLSLKLDHQPREELGVSACVLVLAANKDPVDTRSLLRFALTRCRIDLPTDHQNHADGLSTVLIPTATAKPANVLASLLPAIESVFEQRNLSTGQQATLRIMLHRGQIPAIGDWDCYDVSLAVDAALAPVGSRILAAAPRAESILLVSQRVHTELVAPARRGIDPTAFQRVDLPRGSSGWARVSGYPKPPTVGDGPSRTPPARPAPPTRTGSTHTNLILGSTVGHIGDTHNYGVEHGHD